MVYDSWSGCHSWHQEFFYCYYDNNSNNNAVLSKVTDKVKWKYSSWKHKHSNPYGFTRGKNICVQNLLSLSWTQEENILGNLPTWDWRQRRIPLYLSARWVAPKQPAFDLSFNFNLCRLKRWWFKENIVCFPLYEKEFQATCEDWVYGSSTAMLNYDSMLQAVLHTIKPFDTTLSCFTSIVIYIVSFP